MGFRGAGNHRATRRAFHRGFGDLGDAIQIVVNRGGDIPLRVRHLCGAAHHIHHGDRDETQLTGIAFIRGSAKIAKAVLGPGGDTSIRIGDLGEEATGIVRVERGFVQGARSFHDLGTVTASIESFLSDFTLSVGCLNFLIEGGVVLVFRDQVQPCGIDDFLGGLIEDLVKIIGHQSTVNRLVVRVARASGIVNIANDVAIEIRDLQQIVAGIGAEFVDHRLVTGRCGGGSRFLREVVGLPNHVGGRHNHPVKAIGRPHPARIPDLR